MSEIERLQSELTDLRAQVSQLENDWRKEQEIARKSEDQLFEANKQLGSLAVERDQLKASLEQARKDGLIQGKPLEQYLREQFPATVGHIPLREYFAARQAGEGEK